MTNKAQLIWNSNRQLAHALHWNRFFGHPLDGMTEAHNAQRAAVNRRNVECYAEAAGLAAGMARVGNDALNAVSLEALAIPHIAAAFDRGAAEVLS